MKKITLILLAIWFSAGLINAKDNSKHIQIKENGETNISLISNDKQSSVIEFSVNAYELTQILNSKGNGFVVKLPQGSQIQQKGAPDLSKLTSSVIVSGTQRMEIDIVNSDFIEVKNIDITPSRGNLYRNMDLDKIPYEKGEVYEKDEFFPGKLAELREPYIVRDFRGQTIITYPLQYNPVKKILRIYTKLQVRIVATNSHGINQLISTPKNGINAEFSEIYSNQFLNYSKSRYEPISETGNMLIVCHPDYVSDMADFVEWKSKKGISVELVPFTNETTGTTADALKTYVSNYYSNNGLTYLLLVGDGEDIPSLYKSGDSDVAYSYVSGSDSYPDLFVGRFSAESSNHVKTQADKVIYYERDMDESATWLTNAMGIASNEGGGSQGDDGESDILHMNNIKSDLTNFGYANVAEVYDPGATALAVATQVNAGVSVINYVGHGSDFEWVTSGFSTSNCDALTNVNKYPYIFDVACVNGNFHDQTCFAEAWARASSNGDATGSVAIIASTINQSWDPPMDGQDEMVDILVESYENNIKRSFGGIAYSGCMHMNDEYGTAGDKMTDTWITFGDPSVIVRTKTPEIMSISHPAEILIGVSTIVVDVNADNALACLSLNGEVLGTAVSSGGSAIISFTALSEVVDLDLIVTAYNKVTYQTIVSVIPANGPYLAVKSFVVNDESGNGEVEYAESFNIDLTLENVGTEISEGITASITTDDAYVVSIIENIDVTFQNIAPQANAIVTDKFIVQVKDSVPDQHQIQFNIAVTDNYGKKQVYSSIKKVTLNAPVIKIVGISYNDDFSGNDVNGIIEAGETGEVIFEIKNSGHTDLSAVNAELSLIAASEYLTLNTTLSPVGELLMGSTTMAKFNVTASENTPIAKHIPVGIKVTGGAFETNDQLDVVIGIIPIFIMGEDDVITTCDGIFLDPGGYENYGISEEFIVTILPGEVGKATSVAFTEFGLESGYDYLKIYNGSTVSASSLIGSYDGTSASVIGDNGVVTANNEAGALTFKYYSDDYITKLGWVANITCVDNPLIEKFELTFNVTDANGAINGAIVTIGENDVTTNSSGVAEFTLQAGIYAYSITMNDHMDASGTVEIVDADLTKNVEMTIVGVNEQIVNSLQIYPNPSNGKFIIEGAIIKEIEVFNSAGISVAKQREVKSNVIELNTLEQGIYFVQITTNNDVVGLRKISIIK
ncbi:MAG: T9SS type A sorting domain-containing protein [Salinivirgaceae bacterium]|nr:T9SS type A sorting domain-containing protein [Salinivirgaceae bacterium]